MRLRILIALLLSLMFLHAIQARAVAMPRSMLQGNSSFMTQAMGQTCYAFDLPSDTLPCNPAFMARERERQFKANLFFGNNIRYAKEASDLLQGSANDETVRNLFRQRESSELETAADIAFLTETMGFAIQPVRLNYYTLFRNQALPEVTLFASREESLRAQFASYMDRDLYWGVQIRYLHRKYIAQDFFLTDALAQDGSKLFEPEEQNVLFLEPSLLYANDEHWLRPQLSASLTNWGFADRKSTAYKSSPQFHVSGAVVPDFGPGKWGFGFDAFWDNQVDTALEPLSLGTYYEIGILRVFGSVAQKSSGLGFGASVGDFNLGLAYSDKTVENTFGDKATYRRVYMLLGVEI